MIKKESGCCSSKEEQSRQWIADLEERVTGVEEVIEDMADRMDTMVEDTDVLKKVKEELLKYGTCICSGRSRERHAKAILDYILRDVLPDLLPQEDNPYLTKWEHPLDLPPTIDQFLYGFGSSDGLKR